MKKLKMLCLICCLSMVCSITSFAKDINEENKADLLATPRYFHQWEQVVQNGTGFMVRNHEYNSPFLLLPNMSYSFLSYYAIKNKVFGDGKTIIF